MSLGIGLALDTLYEGDCVAGLKRLEAGSIDLVFADPPFNLGIIYDKHNDRMTPEEYLGWTRQWGAEVVRVLKPEGTFWLAIGRKYAARVEILFTETLGLSLQNGAIWYYTFGANQRTKFTPNYTPLLHFSKDPKQFVFNGDAIRVPSVRQKIGDKRAAEGGK